MFKSYRPNCERIGKQHHFEFLDIYHINFDYADLMITKRPSDATEDYSTVWYECRDCTEMKFVDLPTKMAKPEKEISERGKETTL